MKKIKNLFLLCTLTFLLTGCVKFNANMDIKKDKSMDFSIVYALDTSISGDQQLLEDKDKKELENQGFTITDYSQDNMKGFTISKKIKNIDAVSSTTDTWYSLSGILDAKPENNYIFKMKKGLLKNTYTAKFKFDSSDSDLGNSSDDSSSNSDWSLNNNDFNSSSNFNFESDSSDMDLSSMMSNMDLSFNVILPYSAKSNNASTTSNDNKNLSWNLSSNQAEAIEFEFELYNMTVVYIGIGVILLLVIIIIIAFISKKKNNISKGNTYQSALRNSPIQQSTMISHQNVGQQKSHFEQSTNQSKQPLNQNIQNSIQPSVNQNVQQPSINNQQTQQDNNPFNSGII